jgi:hypothetical protein
MFRRCSYLPFCALAYTRSYKRFPGNFKRYFASSGNFGQKNLCGIVRLCGNRAEAFPGLNLCGICAADCRGRARQFASARLLFAAPLARFRAGRFIVTGIGPGGFWAVLACA